MGKIWATPTLDELPVKEWEILLKHLSSMKYAGIEPLIYEPYKMPSDEIISLLDKNGLKFTGFRTGGISIKHGTTFSHPDPSIRDEAVKRFIEVIHYGTKFGNPRLLVGIMQGRLLPGQNLSEAELHILECLKRCAIEAARYGMEIYLEPINRFELGYHKTVSEVIEVIEKINEPNVKLLFDTFHLNIEESSLYAALIRAKPLLGHIHIADSNRLIPGSGHIDFKEFFSLLRTLDYQGDTTIEVTSSGDLLKEITLTAAFLDTIEDYLDFQRQSI